MGNVPEGIRDKIAKLLAMAESPNENEAKVALLKARDMMAKYKLSMKDIGVTGKVEIKKARTKVKFTYRKNKWVMRLSIIIADAYCCRPVYNRSDPNHLQTREIMMWGVGEDAEIAASVFKYAFDCVNERNDTERSFYGSYCNEDCESYGWGFCAGLKDAFQRQSEQHQEWGLIIVTSEAVKQAVEKLPDSKPVKATVRRNQDYDRGYQDGLEFTPDNKLSTAGA